MALSNERWDWLTVGALRKSANLREQECEDALVSLMRDGLVRGGRSEDWQAILGLAERVGMGARPIRDRRKSHQKLNWLHSAYSDVNPCQITEEAASSEP